MAEPNADINKISCVTMVDMLAVAEQMKTNANSYAFLDQIGASLNELE